MVIILKFESHLVDVENSQMVASTIYILVSKFLTLDTLYLISCT